MCASRLGTDLRIGCSGWSYADWRGRFYPDGLPERRRLAFYAQCFGTVEVNATFYRLPTRDAVSRWVEETPGDFVFAVKASRYLTHVKRLHELGVGIERLFARIEPLVVAGKLGPVLWQLPPNFARDDERLAEALASLPRGRHAFEFRHSSWLAPDVLALLREHDVALVAADAAGQPEPPLETTAPFAYVRFHHGRRGRRGNYSERELVSWARRLRQLDAPALYAYFNNDWDAFAVRNATRLRELIER